MTDPRKWSEDDVVRSLMFIVVVTAGLLRFWNLDAGLPYSVGADEPEVVERAVTMVRTGDFHPHFFDYPALYIYVQFVVALMRFLVGASNGHYAGLAAFRSIDVYPWARACSAALGTATVALTFLAAKRYGRWAAVAGVMLLAVLPTHVRESHYALTDIPLTLFVTLAWLTTLLAQERPTVGRFALAGAMAGLAAATKYNGALVILLPVVTVWMMSKGARWKAGLTVTVIGAAVAAFLVGTPYTLLDLPTFLDRYASLNREYFVPHHDEPIWLIYVKHLSLNMGWPALLLACAGLVLAAVRTVIDRERMVWVLPLLIVLPQFALISGRTLVYARYLLPILPALCVLAGVFFDWAGKTLVARASNRSAWVVVCAATGAVALAFPASNTIQFDRSQAVPSTAEAAYDWLATHVPTGDPLVIEAAALHMPVGLYAVTDVARVVDRPLDTYRKAHVRYLVLTQFSDPNGHIKPDYQPYILQLEQVFAASPSKNVKGPEIRVYRLGP